jgi:hypothetical protein
MFYAIQQEARASGQKIELSGTEREMGLLR